MFEIEINGIIDLDKVSSVRLVRGYSCGAPQEKSKDLFIAVFMCGGERYSIPVESAREFLALKGMRYENCRIMTDR